MTATAVVTAKMEVLTPNGCLAKRGDPNTRRPLALLRETVFARTDLRSTVRSQPSAARIASSHFVSALGAVRLSSILGAVNNFKMLHFERLDKAFC